MALEMGKSFPLYVSGVGKLDKIKISRITVERCVKATVQKRISPPNVTILTEKLGAPS